MLNKGKSFKNNNKDMKKKKWGKLMDKCNINKNWKIKILEDKKLIVILVTWKNKWKLINKKEFNNSNGLIKEEK